MIVKETALKLSAQEIMRMIAIRIDSDRDDALLFVKELLNRIESIENKLLKSHLDK